MPGDGCNGEAGPFPEGGAPTGEPGTDFANPHLGEGCGPSSGDETIEGAAPPELPTAIPIEIDLDLDGESDTTSTTNAELDFVKFFAAFDSGHHTIQARALEWNEDYGMYLTGAWSQYSFYWENASAPDVAELGLLNDTGASDWDRYTQDPRIIGTLEQPFHNVGDVQIEFDLDGDATPDGQASIDGDAAFQFTPTGLSAGWQTISVRSSALDLDLGATVTGSWRSLSFHYEPVGLPEVQGLGLLVDDGSSNSDRITTNSTLIGVVTPTDGEDLTLYFDFDQDGNADTLLSPQDDGQFLYNALELAPGQYTIDVWATRFSPIFGEIETGPTESFSFTLEEREQTPLAISDLVLLDDTGIDATDLVTSDPTVTGRLVGDGSVSRLTVEIDVDGDGIADGTTQTDVHGNFQFSPVGLALGPTSIAARGIAYHHATESLEAGAWSSLSFSLVASTNEAAVIADLGLLNDSGLLGDNRTEDPRLTGRVVNDAEVEGVAVEADLDGDGNADQTVFTDADGRFIIDPRTSAFGVVTVAVRAVEFDEESEANLVGPWSSFSFTYEDQVDQPPETSNLVFDAGDIVDGVSPSLRGQVTSQHNHADLRVEVDADGDGDADFTSSTDAYGQFVVELLGLPDNTPSIDVRALAVNPETKQLEEGVWDSLNIDYVIAGPAAATIVNLSLSEDTGTSATDRVTTNPQIHGGVSRAPVGRIMIVEMDSNGDGVVDGSTIVAADLQWSYSPTGLADGPVTIAARTRDTAVDGATVLGAWTSFSFTLQAGVDPDSSADEQDQQGGVDDAQDQADQDQNLADQGLADAIDTANQNQDASVDAAESQFDQDVAQAASDFAQARAAAGANYQAALAAFAGDATDFDFEPLQWPDSPQLDRLTLPADGAQPQPPQAQPDYQGPAFDFNSNASYLAASNLAEATYRMAVSNAENARRTQDQSTQETYRNAVDAERDRANDAREAAQEAYQSAVNEPAAVDLDAARDSYNTALQTARDNFNDSIDSANQTQRDAIDSAAESAQSSYEAAWDAYSSEAESARDELNDALTTDPRPDADARKAAYDAYYSRILAAGKARDQANAETSHAFSDAAITANTAWRKAYADAQKSLSLAQNTAAKAYDDVVAAHDNELRLAKISATITLEKSLATIERDTTKANADAVRDRDKQLATHAKTEQLAVEQAKSDLWIALANAKKVSLVAWDAAVGTPWTQYQVDLANNELTYFQSLRTAHNTHTQAVANAEKIRADAVADAQHQAKHDAADQKQTLDHGYSDAKSIYWGDSAAELHNATLGSIDQRKTIRDELAGIAHTRAIQSADDGEFYARTVNDAGLAYATSMISGRTLRGVSASTAANASKTFTIARNNASRTLAIANINNNQAWSTSYRAKWDAYNDNVQTASTAQSDAIAGDLKAYHEAVAPLDRDYAVAISAIEGDQSQAVAAAYVVYVQAVAPADKTYEVANVQHVGIREVADANDLRSYRVEEATSYSLQVNTWHSAVNTPWSAMFVNQGAIEIAWASATGAAEVDFAVSMRSANLTREQAQAEAKRLRRIDLAVADRGRTDAIADQNDVYVTAVAAAKYSYALALAGYSLTRIQNSNRRADDQRDDQRSQSSGRFSAAAAAETTYQIAMINASTNYANASASAHAAFGSAAGSSAEDLWDGDIDWETHQSNVESANDTFNSDMAMATDSYNTAAKSAWEAIRDARAMFLGESQAQAAKGNHFYAAIEAADNESYFADKGIADKMLADAILTAKTNLANSNGVVEKTYVSAVAPLDAAYEVTLVQADNAHRYSSVSATTTKNRDEFIADAARREDQIAARGIYETASYQAFADIKSSIAAASPSPRTLAEADAAAVDALWADAVRIARDAYEDALSIAGANRILAINTAEIAQVGSLNLASYHFANTVAWAESAYQIDVSHAATDVSIADAIGQAALEREEVYAKVDYDDAAAAAQTILSAALRDLSDTYSDDVGDAYEQYYLDAAGEWTDIEWTDRHLGGYGYYGYGWGGYYGYGWGGYYGYGYGGYYGYGYGGYYGGYGGYYGGYGGYYGGYGGYYGYGGLGWGGWGLGYHWGYGFGGGGGGSTDAYANLQDALETSGETFDAGAIAAHVTYATSVGDADITRATSLGDAIIALANTRGMAGLAYANAVGTAESTRSTANLTAAATQATQVANANQTHADALSSATFDSIVAGENAAVTFTNLEQTAAVGRATGLATVEANFQQAAANQEATLAVANASGTVDPSAIYAAVYAQARADWIGDVSPAFVTHATATATADGQAVYDIALARGNRNVARANADKAFAQVQSTQSRARAVNAITPTNTRLLSLLGLQNARRASAAGYTKTYESAFATAEKELGIDKAEASKQQEIDRANKVEPETYTDTYRAAIGDATLTFDTEIANLTLAWQQGDASDQQFFTSSSVPLHHAFSTAIIGLDQTYQTQVAIAEETRQHAHATAEGGFFVAETVANNTKRSSTASAVIGLWDAREAARVDAHTGIDNALQLPWTEYLVDAAVARATWWNTASVQYTNLALDRNSAESTYVGRLATAHVTRQQTIATAEKAKSLIVANAQAAEETAKANAVGDYFNNLVLPTKTYVDNLASAEHQKAIDIAQAHRNFIDHENASQRDNEIQAAEDAFDSTLDSHAGIYRSALAGEQADQYLDFANAEFSRAVALVSADVALLTARNNAEKIYRNEESDAYLQSATSWANIDAIYRQYEANSFAGAAAALAASNGSPWAAYDADFYAAQAAHVVGVSNAARTNAIAQATAQKTAEVAQANAETAWRNANAVSDGTLNTSVANAHLGYSTARAAAHAASGGNGLDLPYLSGPADLAGEYVVAGPSNSYRASVYSASGTSYAYPYGGYWWGAWGYFGGGYWFSGYGGNYGYLYGSQVSSAASVRLSPPADQFPDAFWQIDSEQIADQMRDGSIHFRYGDAGVEELVTPVEIPEGSLPPLPVIDPEVSDGVAYQNAEVIAILEGVSEELGELWTLVGSVAQTVINSRPSTILADFASELVGAELHDSSSSSESSLESSVGGKASAQASIAVGRGVASAEAALAAGQEIVTRDEKLDARQQELLDKFNKLLNEGIDNPGQALSDYAIGVKDGFVDGVKNGLGGLLVDGIYYIVTDGVGDAIDAGIYVAKTGFDATYHGLQLVPGIREVGSWWVGYDIGANEERAIREAALKAAIVSTRAAIWTKENLDYATDVLNEVQGLINEGGQVLLEALLTGDTEQLDAILDSLNSKSSVISREALHLTRLALVEIGHAILDIEPKQAGYIVGTIAYEAVETAVLAAIEAGLAAATVGSAGTATPATAGGTAAIVSAKAASFSKLVYRLSKKADLLKLPKVAKAIDRLNELVVWMIKYPMCFVAGTKVHTQEGLKNIEDIRRGDVVLTRDENNPASANRYRRVTELFQTNPVRLLTIQYRNQVNGFVHKLTCTGQHPFFVAERSKRSAASANPFPSWALESESKAQSQSMVVESAQGKFVPADNLIPGDTFSLADGGEASVVAIDEKTANPGETFTTYNFSVEDDHTYFVGDAGVWVHNTGNPCDEAFELFAKRLADGGNEADALRDAIRHIRKAEDSNPLAQKHIDDLLTKLEKDASPVKGLKNGKLAGKLHPKTGVPFDPDGFPIFESFGNVELPTKLIGKTVSDRTQFKEASKRLWESIKDNPTKKRSFTAEQLKAIEKGEPKIPGYTWHHHQNGKTLQLVDEVDHALTGHSGGRQLTGGRPS